MFLTELLTEFIDNGWTTKLSMTDLVGKYNTSIELIRRKEFVYSAWLAKFWSNNRFIQFESIMARIREFDAMIHSLNDEFEKVNITDTAEKIDPLRAQETVAVLKPIVSNLRSKVRQFLASL